LLQELPTESGQIRNIGNWVLYTAVQQNADWKAAGLPIVPLAINLSVVQFRDASLCDTVVEAIRVSGLIPPWLNSNPRKALPWTTQRSPLTWWRACMRWGYRCPSTIFARLIIDELPETIQN
jgi:hypothetical protein